MAQYENLNITLCENNGLIINAHLQDERARKTTPSYGQKTLVKMLQAIHEVVRVSTKFKKCEVFYETFDHYEDVPYTFTDPHIIMRKSKEVIDYSEETNTVPKDWELHVKIEYDHTARIKRPLQLALKALSIYTDIDKLIRKLKKEGSISMEAVMTNEFNFSRGYATKC